MHGDGSDLPDGGVWTRQGRTVRVQGACPSPRYKILLALRSLGLFVIPLCLSYRVIQGAVFKSKRRASLQLGLLSLNKEFSVNSLKNVQQFFYTIPFTALRKIRTLLGFVKSLGGGVSHFVLLLLLDFFFFLMNYFPVLETLQWAVLPPSNVSMSTVSLLPV